MYNKEPTKIDKSIWCRRAWCVGCLSQVWLHNQRDRPSGQISNPAANT